MKGFCQNVLFYTMMTVIVMILFDQSVVSSYLGPQ